MSERLNPLKRKIKRHQGDAQSWAVSYVDLLTVLLCFFIISFNVENAPEAKKSTIQNIIEAFGHKSSSKAAPAHSEITSIQRPSKDLSNSTQTLREIATTTFAKDHGVVVFAGKQLIIEIPMVSFFASGEKKLTEEGQQMTSKMIQSLLPFKDQIHLTVQGHTDPRPIKKTTIEDNWELSVLRASTVLKHFIAAGFGAQDVSAEGFADHQVTRTLSSDDTRDYAYMRKITLKIKEKSYE